MLTLMVRPLQQHWRLNLALFLGLTLAATMMDTVKTDMTLNEMIELARARHPPGAE